MNNYENNSPQRRNFLVQGSRSLAMLVSANIGVYIVGSVFKDLDGSMVAGAKCTPPGLDGNYCGVGACSPGGSYPGTLYCDGTVYQCAQCGSTCGGVCE
jgi:hypothetical protein